MSSNSTWKSSNQNKYFQNVKIQNLNYQDGKWSNKNSDYVVDGKTKTITKVVKNLENQDVLVGVSTDRPFSKLSLGDNRGKKTSYERNELLQSGIDTPQNKLYPGETTTIALQEKEDGKNLHGFTYLENLDKKTVNISDKTKNTGIGISVNGVDDKVDPTRCAVYIDSQDCVTIGNKPRNLNIGTNLTNTRSTVKPEIKLDVNGSVRVDGFISFVPNFRNVTNLDTSDSTQNNAFSQFKNNQNYNFPKGAFFGSKNRE